MRIVTFPPFRMMSPCVRGPAGQGPPISGWERRRKAQRADRAMSGARSTTGSSAGRACRRGGGSRRPGRRPTDQERAESGDASGEGLPAPEQEETPGRPGRRDDAAGNATRRARRSRRASPGFEHGRLPVSNRLGYAGVRRAPGERCVHRPGKSWSSPGQSVQDRLEIECDPYSHAVSFLSTDGRAWYPGAFVSPIPGETRDVPEQFNTWKAAHVRAAEAGGACRRRTESPAPPRGAAPTGRHAHRRRQVAP